MLIDSKEWYGWNFAKPKDDGTKYACLWRTMHFAVNYFGYKSTFCFRNTDTYVGMFIGVRTSLVLDYNCDVSIISTLRMDFVLVTPSLGKQCIMSQEYIENTESLS